MAAAERIPGPIGEVEVLVADEEGSVGYIKSSNSEIFIGDVVGNEFP